MDHDPEGQAERDEAFEPLGRAARRRTGPGRLAWIGATWGLIGFALGIFASVTVPTLFGYQSLTVLSGSMEPTISTGDVIVVERISPLDARVGDIVSFRPPDDPQVVVTHRVKDLEVSAGFVRFVTRGDANTGEERWQVAADGTIGRVKYRMWKLGYVMDWLDGRFVRLGLVVVPVLLLGVTELARIWRRQPEEAPDAPPA